MVSNVSTEITMPVSLYAGMGFKVKMTENATPEEIAKTLKDCESTIRVSL